jgi:hypothetical protein
VVVELAAMAATVLMATAAPVMAAEPIPGASPVPPSWIQGRTLRVQDQNFTVEAPGDGWQWQQVTLPNPPPGTVSFVCADPTRDTGVMVTVFAKDTRGTSTGELRSGFVKGLVENMVAQGWTVQRQSIQPSEVPLPGSAQFVIEAVKTAGDRMYGQGYLLQSDRIYVLQKFAAAPAGFEDLDAMARTFRLIEAPRAYKPSNLGPFYLTVLALVWAAAALLNFVVGRAAVNGALLAGALILLAAGALLVRTAGTLNAGMLGYRMGEAIIPLAIAAWGARRFYKRHGWAELTRPAPR